MVNGVLDVAVRRLARNLNAAVDLDPQLTALQREVRNAGEGGQIGAGLQGRELARHIGPVAGQQQPEVHTLQCKAQRGRTAAIGAQESVDIVPTHRQGVGMDDLAVRKGEISLLTLKGEITLELEKVKDVQVERGGSLQQWSAGPVHVECLGGARAGGNGQCMGV